MPLHRVNPSQVPLGCLVSFFGAFLLAGLLAFWLIGRDAARDWRARTAYVEARCTVVDKRLVDSTSDEGSSTYRPEFDYDVLLPEGPVRARGYDGWRVLTGDRARHEAVLERFHVGQTYPCWYDPQEPKRAVLHQGGSAWNYLLFLLPILLVAVGAGGLRFFLRKKRRPRVEWLPEPELLPATRLSARLTPTLALGTSVLGTFALAAFWNGITWPLGWMILSRWHSEGPQVAGALIVGLFALIGLVILGIFVRSVLVRAGVRALTVEIAPALPRVGSTLEVSALVKSRVPVRKGDVRLRCVERARASGTDSSSTSTHTVGEWLVDARDGTGAGLTLEGTATIAPEGMHSFQSDANAVEWQLVVRCELQGVPDLERTYVLQVRP